MEAVNDEIVKDIMYVPKTMGVEALLLNVRHPLARLHSTWSDKFHYHRDSQVYQRNLDRYFKFEYSEMLNYEIQEFAETKPTFARISFEGFINFIANAETNDLHWNPYWEICRPCDLPYDLISKIEEIAFDAKEILKNLKVPRSVGSFPAPYVESKFGRVSNYQIFYKKLRKMYSNIPPETMLKIYEKYRHDFYLFDYKKLHEM